MRIAKPSLNVPEAAPVAGTAPRPVRREPRSEPRASDTVRSSSRRSTMQSKLKTQTRLKQAEERRASQPMRPVKRRKVLTQDALIAEALETEEGNTQSLQLYLEQEEDRKARQRAAGKKVIHGPRLRWVSAGIKPVVRVITDDSKGAIPAAMASQAAVLDATTPSATAPSDATPSATTPSAAAPQAAEPDAKMPGAARNVITHGPNAAADLTLGATFKTEDSTRPDGSGLPPHMQGGCASGSHATAPTGPAVPALQLSHRMIPTGAAESSSRNTSDDTAPGAEGQAAPRADAPRETSLAAAPLEGSGSAPARGPAAAPVEVPRSASLEISAAVQHGSSASQSAAPTIPAAGAGPPSGTGAPQHSASQHVTAQHGVPQHDAPHHDAPKHVTPQHDAAQHDPITERTLISLHGLDDGSTWADEFRLLLGDHCRWDRVPVVPSRNRPFRPRQSLCVVTGLPARYRDPHTGLAYATREAFATLRAVLDGQYRFTGTPRAATALSAGIFVDQFTCAGAAGVFERQRD